MNPPSREDLILLCERGIVPVEKWKKRDTPAALEQLAICWAYLKAGCDYEVTDFNNSFHDISIFHPTFHTIETQELLTPVELEESTFYIPTQQRLENKSGDWC